MANSRDDHRWRFSLAVLFRAVTLIALALGWLLALPSVWPQAFAVIVLLLGMTLGGIASVRRAGRAWQRFRVWIGFLAGSVVVAWYSSYLATMVQTPIETGKHWSGLGRALEEIMVLLMSPLVVIILVLMLRAWTWSAHDASLEAQHEQVHRPFDSAV